MGDKIKEFWHDQIPGWFPIVLAVVSAAFWIGQQQQSINDRLRSLEIQMESMQSYMRNQHQGADAVPHYDANR